MPRTTELAGPSSSPSRSALTERRVARHARARGLASLSLLVGAVLWSVPATAALPVRPLPPVTPPPVTHAVAPVTATQLPASVATKVPPNGHLLDVVSSKRPVSSWVATDLTTLESAASVVGGVSVAQGPRTRSSSRVGRPRATSSCSPPRRTRSPGPTADVTVLGTAPGVRRHAGGRSSIRPGVTRVFFRSIDRPPRRGRERPEDRRTLVRLGPHVPHVADRRRDHRRRSRRAVVAGVPDLGLRPIDDRRRSSRSRSRRPTASLVLRRRLRPRAGPADRRECPRSCPPPTVSGSPRSTPSRANGDARRVHRRRRGLPPVVGARRLGVAAPPAARASPTALAGLPTEVTRRDDDGAPRRRLDPDRLARRRLVPGRLCAGAPARWHRRAPPSIAAGTSGYVVAAERRRRTSSSCSTWRRPPRRPRAVDDVTMQPLTEQLAGASPRRGRRRRRDEPVRAVRRVPRARPAHRARPPSPRTSTTRRSRTPRRLGLQPVHRQLRPRHDDGVREGHRVRGVVQRLLPVGVAVPRASTRPGSPAPPRPS